MESVPKEGTEAGSHEVIEAIPKTCDFLSQYMRALMKSRGNGWLVNSAFVFFWKVSEDKWARKFNVRRRDGLKDPVLWQAG